MRLKDQNNIFTVDIGATNIRFAIVSGNKVDLINKFLTPKNKKLLLTEIMKNICDALAHQKINGLAISVAGPVKDRKAHLTNITKTEIDFSTLATKDLPLSVINDGAAAVWAEKEYGYGNGLNNIAYITISSGIGGGVIIKGESLNFNFLNEEIGHQKVTDLYKIKCVCGQSDHWESLASGLNISKFMARWSDINNFEFDQKLYDDVYKIFRKAKSGDSLANDFMEEIGRLNARGIDLVAKKYSPEAIVLGGAVALNNQGIILSGIEKHRKSKVPIKFTNLGDEISLIGAAAYLKSRM